MLKGRNSLKKEYLKEGNGLQKEYSKDGILYNTLRKDIRKGIH